MYTIINNRDWNAAEAEFEFIAQMGETPQDPRHHAEGNVAVHTQMVLHELEKSAKFKQLEPKDQTTIWAAALLHDIGKISTTITNDDGSISSPGHSRIGATMARQLMYRSGDIPFEQREEIVSLIRYHGLPLWVFEKPDPAKALIQASLEVNTQLLTLLARADVLGRWCEDMDVLLYRLDCFEELCKEQGCWGAPKSFQTPEAKLHYLTKENSAVDYVPFEQPTTHVIMMSGLPGAGKDFFIKKMKDWPVISLDQIRRDWKIDPTDKSGNGKVVQEAKEIARQYLRKQQSFIWNATNVTRQMRTQLIELFMTYDAFVEIVYVETPYRQLISQNKSRAEAVPLAVVERLTDKLEVPVAWEAHKITYIV
ncbi:HD domain-containing protein [Chitinophaga silvatica]|uniref:HD domain-containing protein n=1 Tax=Chitinophaga silvatica TaxID=2282649 RepID=A0A3E1YGQ6_9BACT|nr:AAA family ATPase [Chitinophaga silvatica]RFS26603.1 HD domain-containing protein [Chitinophaga silvatica]